MSTLFSVEEFEAPSPNSVVGSAVNPDGEGTFEGNLNTQPSSIKADFQHNLPLAGAFFEQAIATNALAHGYVLKGRRGLGDIYRLAQSVLKALNCTAIPNTTDNIANGHYCNQCTSCKWINANAHPGLMTVSRYNYFYTDLGVANPKGHREMSESEAEEVVKKGTVKNIKTGQIKALLSNLARSTREHRMVLFCDYDIVPDTTPVVPHNIAPAPQDLKMLKASSNKLFEVKPLNSSIFNAASSNRFLKTLEEPPAKTLFFFITDAEENLLDTVVSRCQVVPCQTQLPVETSNLETDAENPHNAINQRVLQGSDVYELLTDIKQLIADLGVSEAQFLTRWMTHNRQTMINPATSNLQFNQYKHLQECLQHGVSLQTQKVHKEQSLLYVLMQIQNPTI